VYSTPIFVIDIVAGKGVEQSDTQAEKLFGMLYR